MRSSTLTNELQEFVDYVLDFFVIKLYDKGALNIPEELYQKELEHFWYLWTLLSTKKSISFFEIVVKSVNSRDFSSQRI